MTFASMKGRTNGSNTPYGQLEDFDIFVDATLRLGRELAAEMAGVGQ
jgi:hypothetical protein